MSATLRSPDNRVIVPERLRRRRAAVRRGRGRRRFRRLVAVSALVMVLIAGFVVLRSPLLAVHQVAVRGSTHVTRSDIARVAGLTPGVAMMDVSPGRADKRIEALPWVAHATVKRHWPNRVQVQIRDRVPVAQVAAGAHYALVDVHGRVLQRGVARNAALPLLADRHAGAPGTKVEASAPLLAAARELPKGVRGQVAAIGFARGGAVALTLRGHGVVELGRADGLSAKFASLTTMLDHLGSLGSGCTLDVSVPTAPTLTPEYGCA